MESERHTDIADAIRDAGTSVDEQWRKLMERAVECDREGMLPDSLEYQIQVAIDDGRRPKAVYTVPTFQNPLGWVESLPRRMAVIEITARYGVPVWEDDCYAT